MSKNLTSFTESLRKCRTDKQCHEKYSQHFKIGEQKKLVSSVTARSGMRINYANEGDDKQLKIISRRSRSKDSLLSVKSVRMFVFMLSAPVAIFRGIPKKIDANL